MDPMYFLVQLKDPNDFVFRAKIIEFFCTHGLSSQIFSSDVIYGQQAVNAKKCGCYKDGRPSHCEQCEMRAAVGRVDYGSQTEAAVIPTEECNQADFMGLDLDVKPQVQPLFSDNLAPATSDLPFFNYKTETSYPADDFRPEWHVEDVAADDEPVLNKLHKNTGACYYGVTVDTAQCRKCEGVVNMPRYNRVRWLENHVASECPHRQVKQTFFFKCSQCEMKGISADDVKKHAHDAHHLRDSGLAAAVVDMYPEKDAKYVKARRRLLSRMCGHFPSAAKQCRAVYNDTHLKVEETPTARARKRSYAHVEGWSTPSVEKAVSRKERMERREKSVSQVHIVDNKADLVECKKCGERVRDRRNRMSMHALDKHFPHLARYRCVWRGICKFRSISWQVIKNHARNRHGKNENVIEDTWNEEILASFAETVNECFEASKEEAAKDDKQEE